MIKVYCFFNVASVYRKDNKYRNILILYRLELKGYEIMTAPHGPEPPIPWPDDFPDFWDPDDDE